MRDQLSGQDHSPPRHPSAWIWFAALLCWAVLLLVLSLLPDTSGSSSFENADKLQHFAAYAVLTMLWAGTHCAWRGSIGSAWPIAACGAFGYGLIIELLQGVMQLGRSAESGDLLANALGVLLGCVIFRRLGRRYFAVNDR